MPRLTQTIPALPVRDMTAAVAFYRDRLGFEVLHHDGGFAVLLRDEAVLHLWESGDETWRERSDTAESPVLSGAESFIAGTASCRIMCEGVDELFDELRAADVLHPVSKDGVADTDFGTREFATLDLDGNLLTFFRWADVATRDAGSTARYPRNVTHPELAAEQAYVDHAYECLERMRDVVVRAADTADGEVAQAALDAWAARRLATYEDAERGLCFGRLDFETLESPLYVGRRWVHDEGGDRLVVNWQAPAARPFYTATPIDPQGVTLRRRFRANGRTLLDIADETLDGSTLDGARVSDFLLEELERSRDERMRDIVATIQADQYRLITYPPDSPLVIQGGPGTGKTAVGLHRASWLLYTARERSARSRVLVVGPNRTFMEYVSHVLPALGEDARRAACGLGARRRRRADAERAGRRRAAEGRRPDGRRDLPRRRDPPPRASPTSCCSASTARSSVSASATRCGSSTRCARSTARRPPRASASGWLSCGASTASTAASSRAARCATRSRSSGRSGRAASSGASSIAPGPPSPRTGSSGALFTTPCASWPRRPRVSSTTPSSGSCAAAVPGGARRTSHCSTRRTRSSASLRARSTTSSSTRPRTSRRCSCG